MKTRKRQAPEDRACEVFFEELLPRYLLEVGKDRVAAAGTFQVTVAGERRRTWTVDLDARAVHRGGVRAPAAALETCTEEWLLMIFGELDWQDCVHFGCVRHRGDREVIAGFFRLLAALPRVPVQLGDPTMIN